MNLLLFGQGLDPKYLHPSNMTCNADVALKSGEKIVLCHKAVLVTHVPYFKANFEEKSAWSYEQKVFSNTENDDKQGRKRALIRALRISPGFLKSGPRSAS